MNGFRNRMFWCGLAILWTALGCGAAGNSGRAASTGGATGTGGKAGTGGATGTGDRTGAGGVASQTGNPLPPTASAIFVHHSTGYGVYSNGVAGHLSAYNTAHGTSYSITERWYPAAAGNDPVDYYNAWVAESNGEDDLATVSAGYNVVVFKHCFDVSFIDPRLDTPSLTSTYRWLDNYYLQYAAIKAKLHEYPNIRFLLWTGAALVEGNDTGQAQRAREFFTWVKDTWDEPGDNIFVWDFYELETRGGLFLPTADSSGDSHPNTAFYESVSNLFVNRFVDVIEGRGDTGSLTGR